MSQILVFSCAFAAIALALSLLATRFDSRIAPGACLAFALYLGLDDLFTALGSQPGFDLFGGGWNWSGKVYSLAFALFVLLALRPAPEAIGLQWPRHRVGAACVLTLCLLAASVGLAFGFQPEPPSAETLAFQASMPALAEELAYRGIAPALLLGLVHDRGLAATGGDMPWAVIAATGLMFGCWHGLGYGGEGWSFDWVPALYTCIGGVAYGWMRFATGSLLFPVLAHALGNTVFQLVPLLRG